MNSPRDTRHPTPDTIRPTLLAWFRREKRRLPWRGTRDPYRIWVSEVMLQQTTVGAVLGRYQAFLSRFPTLPALARAREHSVLAAWSGLGYYARARHLHRAAREIVRRHRGRLPRDPRQLRALPGFGEYMAAAVASLAYDLPIAAADANVTRVLSRLFAVGGVAATATHARAVRRLATGLLPRSRPGDITAALMDLGQLICTPRRPNCAACPLASSCEARRRGDPSRYPARSARPATRSVFVAAACAVDRGRALLVQRPERLLQGLWQFPSAEGATPDGALSRLRHVLRAHGLRLGAPAPAAVTQHTIVHRRLHVSIYRALPADGKSRIESSRSARWFTPPQLRTAAIPTLTRKIAAAGGFLSVARRRILEAHPS